MGAPRQRTALAGAARMAGASRRAGVRVGRGVRGGDLLGSGGEMNRKQKPAQRRVSCFTGQHLAVRLRGLSLVAGLFGSTSLTSVLDRKAPNLLQQLVSAGSKFTPFGEVVAARAIFIHFAVAATPYKGGSRFQAGCYYLANNILQQMILKRNSGFPLVEQAA